LLVADAGRSLIRHWDDCFARKPLTSSPPNPRA
jgi:hypothetical protein